MASFVERATLLLNDQSSKPIKNVNAELKALFATANKLKNMRIDLKFNVASINQAKGRVSALKQALDTLQTQARSSARTPLVGSSGTAAIRSMISEAARAEAAVRQIGDGQPSAGLRAALAMIRQINQQARSAQAGLSGLGRGVGGGRGGRGGGGSGGGTGPAPLPLTPVPRPRWGRSVGQDIAFGFRASIGNQFFQTLSASGRSAGQGILQADDARAIAAASGVNVDRLAASVERATSATRGVSQGLVLEAATEQAGQLEAQLASGAITAAQFGERLDATTKRIAENAQIFTTFSHSAERGAEQARQVEKSLALLGTNLNPEDAKKFNTAIRQATIAAGGDIGGQEVKRTIQQLGGTLRTALSPEGLANAILLRDEGGMRSTSELRVALESLIRGNKTQKDKDKQIRAGLRDESGASVFTQKDLGDPIAVAVDEIIPRLQKFGVSLDDPITVANALQKELGFTASEARAFSSIIPNINQHLLDFQRSLRVDPAKLLQDATLRTELANVEAKFQDAAVSLTSQFMPAIKDATGGLGDTFKALSKGEVPSAEQLLGIGTVGLGAAVIAMMDPATRPLGVAALSLNASAAALTAAAAAQTAAAGVGAAGGLLGRGGGFGTKLLKGLGIAALAAGAVSAFKAARESEPGQKLEKESLVPLAKEMFEANRIAREQADIIRDETQAKQRLTEAAARPVTAAQTAIDMATPKRFESIQADNIVVKNLAAIEREDRERAAGRELQRDPLLEDRATRERVPVASAFDKMLSGMDTSAATIQTAMGVGGTEAGAAINAGVTAGGVAAGAQIALAGTGLGQTAAAIIAAAGNSLGAAAAAQIRAATANININVKQATPGANTGASQPNE